MKQVYFLHRLIARQKSFGFNKEYNYMYDKEICKELDKKDVEDEYNKVIQYFDSIKDKDNLNNFVYNICRVINDTEYVESNKFNLLIWAYKVYLDAQNYNDLNNETNGLTSDTFIIKKILVYKLILNPLMS